MGRFINPNVLDAPEVHHDSTRDEYTRARRAASPACRVDDHGRRLRRQRRRYGRGRDPAPTTTTAPADQTNDEDAGAVATTPASTTAPADQKWRKVVPGGDCECADGSEFAFWEHRADATKVVFFLDGGGACHEATTCAFTGLGAGGEENYDWKITDDPAGEGGIFDFARADNPFRDYSFIYVPSCTGDAHLGDVTREYSPELTVEHNGFVNGTAALSYLAEHYPAAAQVVVVGKSVGSISAPIYGGLASDLLPDAQVTVLGGQSGHIPDDPTSTPRSSVRAGAPTPTCPTGRSTRG